MDGTLFDTQDVNYWAYKAAFEEQGLNLNYNDYLKYCIGKQYNDFIVKLIPNNKEIYDIIHKRKKELYPNYLCKARMNEHLINFARLIKSDYNIAIVTTASRKNVQDILRYFNIEKLFDYIITGEDVIKNKPDPECYVKAINHFKNNIEDVVIFEDSKVGIESASKTGATVFVVNKF